MLKLEENIITYIKVVRKNQNKKKKPLIIQVRKVRYSKIKWLLLNDFFFGKYISNKLSIFDSSNETFNFNKIRTIVIEASITLPHISPSFSFIDKLRMWKDVFPLPVLFMSIFWVILSFLLLRRTWIITWFYKHLSN